MSLRAQLYQLIADLPDGRAAQRIVALGAFLDGLPPGETEVAERRLLALTQAYAAMMATGPSGSLQDFFATVDIYERALTN